MGSKCRGRMQVVLTAVLRHTLLTLYADWAQLIERQMWHEMCDCLWFAQQLLFSGLRMRLRRGQNITRTRGVWHRLLRRLSGNGESTRRQPSDGVVFAKTAKEAISKDCCVVGGRCSVLSLSRLVSVTTRAKQSTERSCNFFTRTFEKKLLSKRVSVGM